MNVEDCYFLLGPPTPCDRCSNPSSPTPARNVFNSSSPHLSPSEKIRPRSPAAIRIMTSRDRSKSQVLPSCIHGKRKPPKSRSSISTPALPRKFAYLQCSFFDTFPAIPYYELPCFLFILSWATFASKLSRL